MKFASGVIGFIGLVGCFLVVRPVSAQTSGVECKVAQERIDAVRSRFDIHRDRHITHYVNLREKLLRIITDLETAGYEVAELKPHLQVLDNRISKFTSDYAAWNTQLALVKTYSCSQPQGAVRAAVEKARLQSKIVQADALELRNYYFNEIKPAVVAVKAQKLRPN